MGSSHRGILHGRARHGRGQYLMGSSPVYLFASAAYRLASPPYMVGGLATLWGYLAASATRPHRTVDREFRRFLRRYQWLALRIGKRAAAERIEAEMADRFDSGRSPSRESAAVAACAGAV
jgi:biofilm PGA synthesis N-glycosyltransferase PgaC